MYEKIAWNYFEKTGNIEGFLEYRRLLELNKNEKYNVDNTDKIKQNVGEMINEIDKSEGDSYKRGSL